jgi:hypothetical protein
MVKKKKARNNKILTRLSIFIIIIALIAYIYFTSVSSYSVMKEKNPLLSEKVNKRDFGYLSSFYLQGKPFIADRTFYGSSKATLTMIAYLDLTSNESRRFMADIFSQIDKEFIGTGKLKYYHKNYITYDDIKNKSERFIYAAILSCVNDIKKEYYYRVYFDLLKNAPPKQVYDAVKNYGISENEFIGCMNNSSFDDITQDAIETDNFGNGIGQRFYIGIKGTGNNIIDGIPSYTIFRRTIRDYQIRVGD